jgi:peptide/nickel transport system ATP-binding protein
MAPLVQIDELCVEYGLADGRSFTAIQDYSLTIAAGETVGVVGQSGAGKSTIGKAILGLLGENARIASGSIVLDGLDVTRFRPRDFGTIRGAKVGYIYQNPMTALDPVLTIGEQLLESIETHTSKRGAAARDFTIELLRQAEVPEPESRLSKYPHQLSGGLCQRVVIAIAICARPQLLIADEPTTALDVTVQKAVLATLKKLARQDGISILLITHDMGVIAQMCDRVQVLRYGRLIEEGPAASILTAPTEPYTTRLMAAIPRMDRKLERFEMLEPQDDSEGRKAGIAFLQSADRQRAQGDGPLLEVRNLSKTYKVERRAEGGTDFRALADVSFEVLPGENLGIVGESGSGKSTIGRCILRLQEPDADATIRFRQRDIAGALGRRERIELCHSLQCIFQDPYSSLNPRMSAGVNITYALVAQGLIGKAEARQLACDLLEVVRLPRDAVDKMPHAFSGGERQRIGIARALAFRPEMIFCDEPTSALDVTVQAEVLNLMKDLQQLLGLSMVFVSHDLAVVRQMCDRVLVMRAGEIVEAGPVEEVLVAPRHPYTRDLLASMPGLTLAQAGTGG